ncbi:unnamed protein product [Linum tenue]|uniref:Uncharacterized protein n=1 Tax=Linum tenue TaxID=586396 RepID=A0AAV0MS43_9ROSI|nr:unnamed protein product [Linum tenue]
MSNIRLKDLPSFATSTDAEDVIFHFLRIEARSCLKSSAIIFNTFDEFEEQTLATIRKDYFPFPRHIYTIGPLHLLGHEMAAPRAESKTIGSNLWKEDPKCMEWLDQREQGSVFLTHCGWNSTVESVSAGVPVICWPFFAEQQTNCRYACSQWGIGVELSADVKRSEVVDVIEEMICGEKGKAMKHKALEWQRKAKEAVVDEGSSFINFRRLVQEYCLQS